MNKVIRTARVSAHTVVLPILDPAKTDLSEEEEAEALRAETGIPLHPEVIDWFEDICHEFEIPFKLR